MEDPFEGGGEGIGWGWGLGLLAGAAIVLGTQGRPLIKRAMVGSLALSERIRELGAETVEQLQDLYEEARAEYQQSRVEYQDLRAGSDGEAVTATDEPPAPPRPPRPRAGRGVAPAGE